MEHKRVKCPNCGRSIVEEEMYCYFCERNLVELIRKEKKKSKKG